MGNISSSNNNNVNLRRRNSLRKSVSEGSKRISTEIKLTIIGILLAIFSKNKNKQLSLANPLEANDKTTEKELRNPLDQQLDKEKTSEIKEEYEKVVEDFQEIVKKFADRKDFSESFQNLFSESETKSLTANKVLIDLSEPEAKKGSTIDENLMNTLVDQSNLIKPLEPEKLKTNKKLTDNDMKKINSLFHTALKYLNQEGKNSFTPEKLTEEFFKNFQSKEEPIFKLDKKDLEILKINFFKLAEILTSDDLIKKIDETRKSLVRELQKGISKDIKDKNIKVIASITEINNAAGRIREALEGMKKEIELENYGNSKNFQNSTKDSKIKTEAQETNSNKKQRDNDGNFSSKLTLNEIKQQQEKNKNKTEIEF